MIPAIEPTLSITGYEVFAWLAAFTFAVLDVETTRRGLERGATEVNPIAQRLLSRDGIHALAALKLGITLGNLIIFAVYPGPQRILLPIALALPWGLVSVVNCYTLHTMSTT